MPIRFTVLASGSAGNACLIEIDGFSLLIDIGLGPRQLGARLATVGSSWSRIGAVLLTHTHSDHWKKATLRQLRRQGIAFFCHKEHQDNLHQSTDTFAELHSRKLVKAYDGQGDFQVGPGIVCRPLRLRHDAGATFGFRLEFPSRLCGRACSLAYAADLGSWDHVLADALTEVDLLALEFNHDVAMERASGRSPDLVARVLGEDGHLSNDQAVALVEEVLSRSTVGRLRHLIQLHLSQDCNRPELAVAAAQKALARHSSPPQLVTAQQAHPSPTVILAKAASEKEIASPPPCYPTGTKSPLARPWLPGMAPVDQN